MADKTNKTYAQLSQELADIVAWFESGEVDLDQAIAKYEQASMLISELENYLKIAENKIERITLPEV